MLQTRSRRVYAQNGRICRINFLLARVLIKYQYVIDCFMKMLLVMF